MLTCLMLSEVIYLLQRFWISLTFLADYLIVVFKYRQPMQLVDVILLFEMYSISLLHLFF